MYADGYKYWLAYKKKNIKYYRCCRYKSQCPGRCSVENGKVKNTAAHNHDAEPDRALIDKFRNVLTQRAASEKTELCSIYWEEATQRHSDAAMLYPFNQAESCMRKARRKQPQQTLNTINDLSDILGVSNLFRIPCGNGKDQFYQTTINLESTTCVIFMHHRTLELIGRVEELHIDSSLDIASQSSPQYYLLIGHCVQQHNSYPIFYAIMSQKSHSAFAAILAYVREQLSGHMMPSNILSNFDQVIQSALVLTFPEANIKGFWFHYTNSVLKRMKYLRLTREISKGHGASGIRMLLVLPLLPANYMAPGMEALKKWLQEKGVFSLNFKQLCEYVEQHWLLGIGAEKISIFGLPHNINNHVLNFNKELSNSMSTQIWPMLETLTQLASKTYIRLNKKVKGTVPNKQPKKGQLVSDTIINNATQLWIRTAVHLRNPLQFLQVCSHCINDAFINGYDEPNSNMTSNDSNLFDSSPNSNSMSLAYAIEAFNPSNTSMLQNYDLFESTIQHNSATQQHLNQLPLFAEQSQQHLQVQMHQVPQQPQYVLQHRPSSDPPPLAFFKKTVTRPPIHFSSEPPPLVLIRKS